MTRLISFGCSITYGHGLPDCYVPPSYPGLTPSKVAWPQLVADNMKSECVNLATPGSSNKRIWHNIVHFKFKPDDIVFIMWSYPERSTILDNPNRVRDIGPWTVKTDVGTQWFYKLYNEYDLEMQTKLFISHANILLQLKKIKVYNFVVEKRFLKMLHLDTLTVPHVPLFISDYHYKYPQALDGRHPGVECQREFARDVLKYLGYDFCAIPKQQKLPFLERIKLICKN